MLSSAIVTFRGTRLHLPTLHKSEKRCSETCPSTAFGCCLASEADQSARRIGLYPFFLAMTTLKRLGDDDVRAVFSCLRSHDLPPPHLHFQIVPVGPRGLKLSPPSHEFEDGLYVLLRPQKSKKKSNEIDPRDRVPSQLSHLIMTELPPETCPWSLSGPQYVYDVKVHANSSRNTPMPFLTTSCCPGLSNSQVPSPNQHTAAVLLPEGAAGIF
jgi:hypothetical protein